MTYHGLWNLGGEGTRWWIEQSGLPPSLRFLIGVSELCAALALTVNVLARLAAIGLFVIFVGAIPQHWAQGFSFKHGGWEPLLVYALLSLAIATGIGFKKGSSVSTEGPVQEKHSDRKEQRT